MASRDATVVLCPVCGNELVIDPWRLSLTDPLMDKICRCCNIHFGYDDAGGSLEGTPEEIYALWREWWVRLGMPWVHTHGGPPAGWDPVAQLRRIGVELPSVELPGGEPES